MLDTPGADLFSDFDPDEVAAIHAQYVSEREADGQARAIRRQSRHQMRRAKAQAHLAELLPSRFVPGESWHVISHGDIDAQSYFQHAINGVEYFDFVLISTWCICKDNLLALESWLDAGKIDRLALLMGEIFPSRYGDEYEFSLRLQKDYGVQFVVARNHSKITLAANYAEKYFLVIESSANSNANPRIEQTVIHADQALYDFYLEFFSGIRSIDRDSARAPR